jgi:hypothetical protein
MNILALAGIVLLTVAASAAMLGVILHPKRSITPDLALCPRCRNLHPIDVRQRD